MRLSDVMMTSAGSSGDAADADGDQPPEPGGRCGVPAGGAGGVEIDVVTRPGLGAHPDVEWIRRHLESAVSLLSRPVKRLHVLIADDQWMVALNSLHLGVEGTTDVLSFPDTVDRDALEADVVICADEAVRQAQERAHSIERELLLYALHGLLHCVGYDDQTPAEFEAMHAEEDRLMEALGVGPTFDRGAPRAGRTKAALEGGP